MIRPSKRSLSRGTQCSWKRVFQRIADEMRSSCLRDQTKNPSMTMQHHLNLQFLLMVVQSSVEQLENLDHLRVWYDYEIWQMDVKTAFLNGFIEEEIYMDQPEGFTTVGEEHKVHRLQRSLYSLKQASQSWNMRFDEVIRGYEFIKNEHVLVYTRRSVGAQLRTLCFMSMTSWE
ncbi:UNVERIFIED_CONTAM: hypothetical protein Slati_2950500 [Sesamum latifolium]|uniref:Reverse transcriptase Ty1/copia-type domain-containing protein n=1 Tax=Sesamum latifolium TaxID=2727402 RepID=A0AAW2VHS4_9LAMI